MPLTPAVVAELVLVVEIHWITLFQIIDDSFRRRAGQSCFSDPSVIEPTIDFFQCGREDDLLQCCAASKYIRIDTMQAFMKRDGRQRGAILKGTTGDACDVVTQFHFFQLRISFPNISRNETFATNNRHTFLLVDCHRKNNIFCQFQCHSRRAIHQSIVRRKRFYTHNIGKRGENIIDVFIF